MSVSVLRPLLALVGVAAILATSVFAYVGSSTNDAPPLAGPDDNATRLIVLGDTGTGEAGQYRVKDAFLQVCAQRGCDAAIITGDLIYDTGAASVDDPQFDSKFELPYADVPFPFYLTLGNHDNSDSMDDGMGTDAGKGNVQVAYHYKAGTSGKWQLPARYYSARSGDVELFSLDTNTMMSYGIVRNGVDPLATAQAQDPAMLAQAEWLENALRTSDARWKIAFGHHPLYSNGEHGNAGAYESQGTPLPTTLGLGVKNFLETHVCTSADMYLAGHDHDLQWIQERPGCEGTELLISGAGAKSRELQDRGRNPVHFQRGGTLGFWWIELRDDGYSAAVYDDNATLLYERSSVASAAASS